VFFTVKRDLAEAVGAIAVVIYQKLGETGFVDGRVDIATDSIPAFGITRDLGLVLDNKHLILKANTVAKLNFVSQNIIADTPHLLAYQVEE